jgi:hypothetical protein
MWGSWWLDLLLGLAAGLLLAAAIVYAIRRTTTQARSASARLAIL